MCSTALCFVAKAIFIFMNDVSNMSTFSDNGCYVDVCVNHVCNADDLCLITPCVIALQELL